MCRFTLKERKCRTRRNVGIGTIGFGDRNLDPDGLELWNLWVTNDWTECYTITKVEEITVVYIQNVSKNVPHLVCYNFDTREQILISFCRNAM